MSKRQWLAGRHPQRVDCWHQGFALVLACVGMWIGTLLRLRLPAATFAAGCLSGGAVAGLNCYPYLSRQRMAVGNSVALFEQYILCFSVLVHLDAGTLRLRACFPMTPR